LPGPIQLNTAPRMAIGQAPAILSGRAVIIEFEFGGDKTSQWNS